MKNQLLQILSFTGLAAALLSGCSSETIKMNRAKVRPFSGTQQTVFAAPVSSPGTIPGCGGSCAGYVSYQKTVANGWGWAPDTNNTSVFTAADGGGRSDTKISYAGKNGDTGCATTPVTMPNPPVSAAYRFTIYFPSHVPGTNYPIILTGFKP